MPRKIVTTDGVSFQFREFELPPLNSNDVRIRARFAAPKHGTELHAVTGSPFDRKRWDPELRMFLPRNPHEATHERPERSVGNMLVGTVTETGRSVTRFRAGDLVFGYGPIGDFHQASEESWFPLGELSDSDAVCVDPAHVAFVAVRDGGIRIGDSVAVFGLGAIGLMAIQIARAGGARKIIGVEPIPERRRQALRLGADSAWDPVTYDSALEIKQATDKKGVDVAIETSGSGRALHEAVRCLRQCGTVVHVPWGPKDAAELHLDEEFHLNRPRIIGSQAWAGWGNPDRDFPLWDHARAFEAAIELFRAGLITGNGIVTPFVDFEEAPERLSHLLHNPAESIKIGVLIP